MSFQDEKRILDARPLPDEFYRGIDTAQDYDFVLGFVKKSAFQFKQNRNGLQPEMDECSVNWNDDNNAVDGLKNKYGYVLISIRKLFESEPYACFFRSFKDLGILDYGRDCLEENNYHGNIYLRSKCEKSRKELIQHLLIASCADSFVQN